MKKINQELLRNDINIIKKEFDSIGDKYIEAREAIRRIESIFEPSDEEVKKAAEEIEFGFFKILGRDKPWNDYNYSNYQNLKRLIFLLNETKDELDKKGNKDGKS